MGLTPEQLELRRTGIGSSDIAGLMNLHPSLRPIDVYLDKIGEQLRELSKDLADKGNFLEEATATWWAKDNEARAMEKGTTMVHPDHPWVLATPDYLPTLRTGELGVLEVKVSDWGRGWGAPGTDQVPPYVIAQVHWQVPVVEAIRQVEIPVADVTRLHGGRRADYIVPIDRQLCQVQLEVAGRFWEEHVLDQRPPPLDGSNSSKEWLKKRFPGVERGVYVRSTGPSEDWVFKLRRLRAQEKQLKAERMEAENHLKEVIGTNAGLEGPWGRISWGGSPRKFLPKFIDEEAAEE